MEKVCKKSVPKDSPKPLINFCKPKTTKYMQVTLLEIRYFEKDYQSSLKTLAWFFLSNLFMDKIMKNKRGLELATSLCSGFKTFSKKFLFHQPPRQF